MRNQSNDQIISRKLLEKKAKSFKSILLTNSQISKNDLIEKLLNIVFVDVATFQSLNNSWKRKNNYQIFSLFMKKIIEVLKSLKATRDNISKNLKIHIVIEVTSTTQNDINWPSSRVSILLFEIDLTFDFNSRNRLEKSISKLKLDLKSDSISISSVETDSNRQEIKNLASTLTLF